MLDINHRISGRTVGSLGIGFLRQAPFDKLPSTSSGRTDRNLGTGFIRLAPFDKLPSTGSGRTASGLKEGLEYERLGWTTRRCLACRVCFPVLDSMTINGNGVLFLREAVFLVLRMSHVPH